MITSFAPASRSHRPPPRQSHPAGLRLLCGVEGLASFALYGFEAMFSLYMVHDLLTPAHSARIWGLDPVLWLVGHVYGPQTAGAPLAGAIAGLALAFLWVTPLLAGFLADRGVRRMHVVAGGALLMAAGLFMIAVPRSFILGLGCLLLGYGGIGTLKAQVGALYALDDPRRSAAYQLFSLAVQAAVILSPILCGWMSTRFGWAAGFALPGVVMVVALAVYLAGRRLLPADAGGRRHTIPAPPLNRRAWATILVLIGLLPILALVLATNMQIFNAYLIWGERHYALRLGGHTMPVAWLISLDGFISVLTTVAVLAFWRWWSSMRREPDEIVKICVGAAISPLAPLVLALASWRAAAVPGDHRIGLGWGLLFHALNDIGFANVYAIGMALYSRAAPARVNTTMVSMFVLSLFVANLIVGKLATLLDRLGSVRFWLLHAAIGAGGFVLIMIATALVYPLLAPVAKADPAS